MNAVVILDGFSHMRLIDDGAKEDNEEMQRKHKIELLFADSEEEDTASDEKEKAAEAERKRREEEEKPKEWTCICTLINPISMKQCDCCGSDAPPMEQIVAEHLQRLNEERKQKGEVVSEVKQGE
jgi:hypothetical protein